MSSFTTEMIQKAKEAKTAEELLSMAKANNFEMTLEEAQDYFAQINVPTGELDDDELDNVAGGGCGTPEKWGFDNGENVWVTDFSKVECCCPHSRTAKRNGGGFEGNVWFNEFQYREKGSDGWQIMCRDCGSQVGIRGNGDLKNYGIRKARWR